MARTNPLSKSSLIALVSDTARDLGMVKRFEGFATFVETRGLDVATPALIVTLLTEVAAKDRKIAELQRATEALSAEVVAWDSQDMAISAASKVGRHAAPEVTAPKAPEVVNPVWLTYGRKGILLRCSNDLAVPFSEIVGLIARAVQLGHTAQDATGAWVAHNGGGDWTPARIAAAQAMGLDI